MPRRKRRDTINEYHLDKIERQSSLLGITAQEAEASLTPFRPHYDALHEMRKAIRRALNVLNGRDPDHIEPHLGFMHNLPKPESE